jgi:protocatechuate 3,4-dioxygenase beta subunit
MSAISRRQALAGLGSISVGALIAACSDDDDSSSALEGQTNTATVENFEPRTSSGGLASRFDDAAACRRTAEETEGPFYFDVDKIRSDIREDREGVTLRLGVRVRGAAECEPIANAVVDVWHCDAEGSYSEPGESYCRGAQVTNRDGIVEFTTVYPGWYPGRTVHIHGKVHLDRQTVLTTQFYFDDSTSARVFVEDPYPGESNRDGFNDSDGLYQQDLELTLSKERDGYLGLITLDVATA